MSKQPSTHCKLPYCYIAILPCAKIQIHHNQLTIQQHMLIKAPYRHHILRIMCSPPSSYHLHIIMCPLSYHIIIKSSSHCHAFHIVHIVTISSISSISSSHPSYHVLTTIIISSPHHVPTILPKHHHIMCSPSPHIIFKSHCDAHEPLTAAQSSWLQFPMSAASLFVFGVFQLLCRTLVCATWTGGFFWKYRLRWLEVLLPLSNRMSWIQVFFKF